MRGRLDPLQVQLRDPIDVLQNSRELHSHRLDLLLRKAQPGQPRNVEYLLSFNHGGDSRCLANTAVAADGCWPGSQLESPRMQGEAAEKLVVLSLRLLALSFAVV